VTFFISCPLAARYNENIVTAANARKERDMKTITGTWYGQRGSRLELHLTHDGHIEGRYYTANNDEAQGVFDLIGMSDTRAFGGSRSVGFVVCWNNEYVNQHSVTAWSGQYQIVNDEEVLATNWLLTRETSPEHGWAATMIGSDTFKRTPVAQPHATPALENAP